MGDRGEKGLLIVFEGIDGTGKSTQLRLLADHLRRRRLPLLVTREPSDGPIGRRIRQLFSRRHELSRQQELKLFLDDRREHVEQVIAPALAAGQIVLCDRYYYSTAAYQGAAGGDPETILRLNGFAPRPDLVLLLELSPREAVRRIRQVRGDTPNDFEQLDHLEKVYRIFAAFDDDRIRRINGNGPIAEVQATVREEVDSLLRAERGDR